MHEPFDGPCTEKNADPCSKCGGRNSGPVLGRLSAGTHEPCRGRGKIGGIECRGCSGTGNACGEYHPNNCQRPIAVWALYWRPAASSPPMWLPYCQKHYDSALKRGLRRPSVTTDPRTHCTSCGSPKGVGKHACRTDFNLWKCDACDRSLDDEGKCLTCGGTAKVPLRLPCTSCWGRGIIGGIRCRGCIGTGFFLRRAAVSSWKCDACGRSLDVDKGEAFFDDDGWVYCADDYSYWAKDYDAPDDSEDCSSCLGRGEIGGIRCRGCEGTGFFLRRAAVSSSRSGASWLDDEPPEAWCLVCGDPHSPVEGECLTCGGTAKSEDCTSCRGRGIIGGIRCRGCMGAGFFLRRAAVYLEPDDLKQCFGPKPEDTPRGIVHHIFIQGMPGYLPSDDPVVFNSHEEAVDYARYEFKDWMEQHGYEPDESLDERDFPGGKPCVHCSGGTEEHEAEGNPPWTMDIDCYPCGGANCNWLDENEDLSEHGLEECASCRGRGIIGGIECRGCGARGLKDLRQPAGTSHVRGQLGTR